MVVNFSLFGGRSNSADDHKGSIKEPVAATLPVGAWSKYVVAPLTYLSHSFKRSSDGDTGNRALTESDKSVSNEVIDGNRGLSAAIMMPWRQYVVAPAKYLSKSTQFAVLDKVNMEWLFRLDNAHPKGAKYPHINVNHRLTGVPDPHTRVSGALVKASGPAGKVMRNVGDIATVAAIGIDTYRIGAVAYKEVTEKGGIGAETGKVAAGVGASWSLGLLGAAVGGKASSVAGGLVAGPVGAGVFGILGAVAGGVGGSIKGRSMGENAAEQAAEQLAEHHAQAKCKL